MAPDQPSSFLDLAAETRAQIFSYLLPNVPVTDCDPAWSPNYNESPSDYSNAHEHQNLGLNAEYSYSRTFGHQEPYSAQIMLLNRQIYAEAKD
ncbi:MAG: hypothetical protein Q9226_007730 [Calogaya cf. arnoldii]